MVEILQSYCQISSLEFCRNRSASGWFSLQLLASSHVCPEKGHEHKLQSGFTGFIKQSTERKIIMTVQTVSFPVGKVVITPNALDRLTPAVAERYQ
jgi:hypothetical protein